MFLCLLEMSLALFENFPNRIQNLFSTVIKSNVFAINLVKKMSDFIAFDINKPTAFQCKIQNMNIDQFENNTNIKKIIKTVHFQGHENISDEDMHAKLIYYFGLRMENCWCSNLLKFLEIDIQEFNDVGIQCSLSNSARTFNIIFI